MMYNLFILFFTILLGVTSGHKLHTTCDPVKINCICGTEANSTHVQLKLQANLTVQLESGEVKCSGYPKAHEACTNISCSFVLNDFGSVPSEKDFISSFYPKIFTILAGDFHGGHRITRQNEACHVTPLKHAHIKCWRWPKWIKCNVKCIHGHAMKIGDKSEGSMSMNCRLSENNWKPAGFIDCQPYMNCHVQLTKPGDMKCKQPIDGPAYCDISCNAFENYEAVAHQRYECVDDSFARKLPHCAIVNEYVSLLNKPT